MAFYFVLALGLDSALWLWAWSQLRRKLRTLATQRYEPRQTLLARIFSRRQATPRKPAAS